jgi:hypothetical protein
MNEFNTRRVTRLTALMAGHGLTFLQVYSFYAEVARAYMHPHLRAQVVTFGAVMLVGIASAYAGLLFPEDKRPALRRGVEAVSAGLLVLTWIVLGNSFLNLH